MKLSFFYAQAIDLYDCGILLNSYVYLLWADALRALQRTAPDLGELATAIALAFDPSAIENPQMARLILEKTCRRIVAGQPGSREAMIQHLAHFGDLNCLSPAQVTDFTDRIRKLA